VYIGSRQNKSAATIARQQINASLVSASRQVWIDKLRDSIAEFQALLYNLGFRGGVAYELGPEEDKKLQQAIQLRSRIALLINPAEADHKQLVIEMGKALSVAYAAGHEAAVEMARIQATITEISQGLLKREWERVKAGEPERSLVQASARP
jgi:hypothetical protein